ncbi:ABC transporter ATP-binding protein [Alkaliphilus peptidifermentans]|uniref:Peptide/nickel transport system ATP-binding protein n=1 Tax=Alkaliphilus peptidifermentans DSM 18978 TaxID=1120976 RepID=A0A1G5EB39_9FIRM|nr:ABC transporter ATP-binding protein [Alkaliphilus peptidifermentans]SCY23900.1 peptide/nickel transport system ATP-binding protein [Alkaliphilus peptidifermentans DSM 18978]
MSEVLKIENLEIKAKSKNAIVTILDNISFSLKPGQTLGIVGESGCGKSITALSILGLLNKHISITGGKISFREKVLSTMKEKELRKICGREIGMIFQEPMTALNPLLTIGRQLAEPLRTHLEMSKREAHSQSIELLNDVGIKEPEKVLKCYPYELSGGMRQRVLIAIAISCNPLLLIADEPTTALDVTVQAQVLRIMKRLIKEKSMSMLLISHDLGVISQMCERVIVMYSGEIVEEDTTENIINNPKHPYTKKLLLSAKELVEGRKNLTIVNGSVPRPEEIIIGCKFAARCEERKPLCMNVRPPITLKLHGSGRVKCWEVNN